jgi:hypothetical protein
VTPGEHPEHDFDRTGPRYEFALLLSRSALMTATERTGREVRNWHEADMPSAEYPRHCGRHGAQDLIVHRLKGHVCSGRYARLDRWMGDVHRARAIPYISGRNCRMATIIQVPKPARALVIKNAANVLMWRKKWMPAGCLPRFQRNEMACCGARAAS